MRHSHEPFCPSDARFSLGLGLRYLQGADAWLGAKRCLRASALVALTLAPAHGQTLSLLNQLEFGTFAVQTGGAVVIDPASGARSRTGDVWLLGQNAGTPARVALTRLPGADFSVLLPPDNLVTLSKGGSSMELRTFRSSPSSGRMVGSTQIISIGATLIVQPNQPPGGYVGSFQVTVSFP